MAISRVCTFVGKVGNHPSIPLAPADQGTGAGAGTVKSDRGQAGQARVKLTHLFPERIGLG